MVISNKEIFCRIVNKVIDLANFKISVIEFISPIMDLIIRIYISYIFFSSALLKLPAGFLWIGKGSDWDTTIFLFAEEYSVPLLSPEFAAYSATFFEITCPVLLVLGIWARGGAFILLFMTAVIEFTYKSYPEHIFWALLLGHIIFKGAGKISIDHFIRKKYYKSSF